MNMLKSFAKYQKDLSKCPKENINRIRKPPENSGRIDTQEAARNLSLAMTEVAYEDFPQLPILLSEI